MQRNAQNDQQSNTENDQQKGRVSHYLRRYRRGRHITNDDIQLFVNETATNMSQVSESKINQLSARVASIAATTRSKINPLVKDATSAVTRATESTLDPFFDKATEIGRTAKLKIDPLAARLAPTFHRAMTYRISPLAGGLALSMALGGVGLAAAAHDPASATPASDIHIAADTGPAVADAADGTATTGTSTNRKATDRTTREQQAKGNAASRSHNRTAPKPASSAAKPQPKGAADAKPADAPAPPRSDPAPVGGLIQIEMANAITIVRTGQEMNLPKRAFVVAIATALQESHLRNLGNSNVPASLDHPNEGVGSDYDSVGLFQQRPNWGSIDQRMDAHQSAQLFYQALLAVPGWDQLDVTVAAQQVQGSAFPDAYAKWQGLAEQIVDAIAP
ncbi:hypothetical protein HC031_23070 [Planosporangium thailandense]|uniref:Peptidase M23 n=1 Tax=Planosporangium thailandense TaxID=765197 RepID=A0ABX0Y2I8_9ACTN|nr:hypothetical protein [Planosporangium thailandense]NJC72576.1 hypothetical protein [Planosporangium thailandense]